MKKLLPLAVALLFVPQAHATNGYFSHGFGIKSQGMGGVGIALPQDALAAATNPAGMALIGDRADIGLSWFKPNRRASLSGTNHPLAGAGFSDGSFSGNGRDEFYIPEGGYNKMVTPDLALGVSLYGNGGMNATYDDGGIPLLNGGTGKTTGINYIQAFVAPTVAWKVTETQSLGASLIIGYQRFKARGIDGFTGISSDPGHVTGRGYDDAWGVGLHLGWIGQITDRLTLGATYQTKTRFQDFDRYKGLFAGHGEMDAPATYGVGLAFKARPDLTLAADVQRILYSDVHAIGNSIGKWNSQASNLPAPFNGTGNLGMSSGPGFGWKDVTVYKLGASYDVNPALTLRAGYSHTTEPIRRSQTLFNILAPGVVQDHVTLGGSYKFSNDTELSFSYMHAFRKTVHGPDAIPALFGGGNVDLKMHQDAFGIAYGWNL